MTTLIPDAPAVRPRMSRPPTPATEWMPLRRLFVDHEYQRERSQARVDYIIEHFDPDILGVLLVAEREGTDQYAILDGGHRAEVLRRLGYTEAPVQVLRVEHQQEPIKFTSANRGRAQVQAWQLFRADLASGDPIATDIRSLVEGQGMRLTFGASSRRGGDIACVAALRQVYIHGGRGLLHETLRVLATAEWSTLRHGLDAHFVLGVALFLKAYAVYGPEIRVAEKMREHGPQAILRRARSRQGERMSSIYRYVAEVLVDLYNERLSSNRLPELLAAVPGWKRAYTRAGDDPMPIGAVEDRARAAVDLARRRGQLDPGVTA